MNTTALIEWYGRQSDAIHRTAFLVLLALPGVWISARFMKRSLAKKFSPQAVMLFTRTLSYGGTVIVAVMVLREFGFKLSALLGAAGIAGIAIGFAAQTSLSNVISGLFLVLEKPFQIGDVIKVDGNLGVVHSMDLLCINLRTFDNQLIRIPNENLIKTSVTNITRFPIRRFDLNIGVAYKEDMARVTEILRDVADRNPYSLDEPEPIIIFKGFGNSSLDFLLGIWFAKDDFSALRNSIQREVKERFDAEGIEIPFPHLSLYAGEATNPFPVTVVDGDKSSEV